MERQTKEQRRDAREVIAIMIKQLWQDLRYGFRTMLRTREFSTIAVLTLALGIGANSAIFTVVNHLILKPLPYLEPERLMKMFQISSVQGKPDEPVFQSYPRYQILRDQGKSFADFAGYTKQQYVLTGTDLPERLQVEFASASYFPLLGVEAVMGRTFTMEEDVAPGARPVALISYGLWLRRFGSDPNVLDKTIELNKRPLRIIGVLPRNFKGQSGTAEVWAPLMMVPEFVGPQLLNAPDGEWFEAILKLKPGVTQQQAQAALDTITESIERAFPPPANSDPIQQARLKLVPLQEASVDPMIRQSFLLLLGAVGFVMLIVCANIASLTLVRALARRKEMALRASLRAGQGRLMRQIMTESLLLAIIGGGFALLVAWGGVKLLVDFRPGDDTQFWTAYARTFDFFTVRIDGRVLAFNFLLSLVTGVLFGLTPAWQTSRLNINESLNDSSGRSVRELRMRRLSMRNLLLAVQIALSLILLAGAGLMVKSVVQLQSAKLGFNPDQLVTLRLWLRRARPEIYQDLLTRTTALPGVKSASMATGAPLMGRIGTTLLMPERRAQTPDSKLPRTGMQSVTPNYFNTLGITLLKGRSFTEQDRVGTPRVAIINATAAAVYWPGEDPIGKRFELGFGASYPDAGKSIEVIGVVDDVNYSKIEEPVGPEVYLSYLRPTAPPSLLIVRGSIDPTMLIAALRDQVRQIDKNAPVSDVKTMAARVIEMTSRTRFSAMLMGLFAGLALLLAAIGIYGVTSYSVSTRTREIGIRIALRARLGDVFKLVLSDGVLSIWAGLLIGVPGALAVTRLLKAQLYNVSPADPLTFAGVIVLLLTVALLACWIPVRRAIKVNPLIALRYE